MKKFIVILAAIISPDTSLYTNDINGGNVLSHTSIGNIKKFLTP